MQEKLDFYIDGKWVAPLSQQTLDVENPATEEIIARISMASVEDVDRAVAAARRAFPAWSVTPLAERIALLERLLDISRDRLPDLARAMTAEMGAPASMSLDMQAEVAVGHLEGFLEALKDFHWQEKLPNGDTILREPVGVCGLITPWNWPLNQITLKVLPVIATGCTAVLKPSEMTPLSAMLYMEILDEAGVPAGVVNLVNGDGPVAGAALSRHPEVDLMSFTGSTRAGAAVTRDAAETVKRVALELGGKSPNLVFADCGGDLEARVSASVAECFLNTGQSCDAPTRLLAERSVYDRVCRIAADTAKASVSGDPTLSGDHIGPLVSGAQWDRVQGFIETALAEGGRLIAGGPGKPEGMNSGHFVRATVFADVTPDMTIWRQEIFGPVLAITPFDTEAEAIDMANDTEYGLAAYVQTGDRDRAMRVARGLRAGMVHVNGQGCGWGSPFGGYKRSGVGREGGRFGLEEFLEVKALHMAD